jgi:hypothetical protein
MDSMRVAELLKALDEFREKLIEHRELWGKSLSQPMPDFPVATSLSWTSRVIG